MEVYLQSSGEFKLFLNIDGQKQDADIDDGGYAVQATVKRMPDGETVLVENNVERLSEGVYRFLLSPLYTQHPGKFKIEWSYVVNGVTYQKDSFFDIVVPYTTYNKIIDMYPELSNVPIGQINKMESIARKIINFFCGQEFSFELNKIYDVVGTDDEVLKLPRRIFRLEYLKSKDGVDLTDDVDIYKDYYLIFGSDISDIANKTLFELLFSNKVFSKRTVYYVKGDWGWQWVPEEVSLAATMLVNDYLNDDTTLRRHGVMAASFGDESYRFATDFFSTGNIDVDSLLSMYRMSGIEVI